MKPPLAQLEYGPGGRRTGQLEFPVEFYVAPSAELKDNAQAMYDWYGVLLEQLTGDYDIGGPSEVVDATITGSRAGTIVYDETNYVGIVFTVRVRLSGAYNAIT